MRAHVEAATASDHEAAPPAPPPALAGLQGRALDLQRSAGNSAVCGLPRAQRSLARQPAAADDDVIAEAKRMLSQNDRGPDAVVALVRRFGKGRVAAPVFDLHHLHEQRAQPGQEARGRAGEADRLGRRDLPQGRPRCLERG